MNDGNLVAILKKHELSQNLVQFFSLFTKNIRGEKSTRLNDDVQNSHILLLVQQK